MKVYTIKDIAAMAGVSVTTVSRVLNNRPDVNSATREKVEQIRRALGVPELDILPYSSLKGEGRSELLDVIADSL